MNSLDMILLVFLAAAALVGWKTKSLILLGLGFVFTLAPLAAFHGAPLLEPLVRGAGVSKANAMPTAAFLALAGAALFIFGFFQFLSSTFQALMLGWLDRGFGAGILMAGLFTGMIFANSWLQITLGKAGQAKLIRQSFIIQKVFNQLDPW